MKGEVEVKQRAKDVSVCPECDKEIEDGQERTIVSGKEWHKVGKSSFCWLTQLLTCINQQCYRKLKGEVEVKQREKVVSICPECDSEIEDGQERTIVSGKEWHKVRRWCVSVIIYLCSIVVQQCYRKLKGEVEVKQRAKEISMCPECDSEIEDGQEKVIVSGKEWHKVRCLGDVIVDLLMRLLSSNAIESLKVKSK
jgi:thioredoxin reductase